MALPQPLPFPDVSVREDRSPWIVNELEGPVPAAYLNGTWILQHPHLEWDLSLMTSLDHQGDLRRLETVLMAHQVTMKGARHRGFTRQNANLVVRRKVSRKPDLVFYWEAPPYLRREGNLPPSIYLDRDPPPDLVVEVLSPSTWESDVGGPELLPDQDKMLDYARMGIAEYWIVRPAGERLPDLPRLQIFTLVQERYLPVATDYSRVLDTAVQVDAASAIRVWNPQVGDWYPLDGLVGLRDATIQERDATIQGMQDDIQERDATIQEIQDDNAAKEAQIAKLQRLLDAKTDSDG